MGTGTLNTLLRTDSGSDRWLPPPDSSKLKSRERKARLEVGISTLDDPHSGFQTPVLPQAAKKAYCMQGNMYMGQADKQLCKVATVVFYR